MNRLFPGREENKEERANNVMNTGDENNVYSNSVPVEGNPRPMVRMYGGVPAFRPRMPQGYMGTYPNTPFIHTSPRPVGRLSGPMHYATPRPPQYYTSPSGR